jgi:hypothetical protein
MEEVNVLQKAEPILRVLKVAPSANLRRWLR